MAGYDIFDVGFDALLSRGTQASNSAPPLPDVASMSSTGTYTGGVTQQIENQVGSEQLITGVLNQILYSGKTSFADATAGFRMGKDADEIYKWIIGDSTSSVDWAVTTPATLTIKGAGLVSPTLSFGKTSFGDSVHAGYYISSAGVYIGSALDATAFKYTVATGVFDFIGTISSRSTAIVASAINASGNLITDVINAKLDTASKDILSDFNFGSVDYAGAVNAGTVAWNTTTGAITGGSGVLVYRGGIVGVNAGVTTFAINATTGDATFAGNLSAPSGNIGGFAIGSTTLTAASGGNTTILSSGSTAFSAGPTGSPTVTITQAGVLTALGAVINGSPISGNDIFGSGEDGTVTISVNTSLSKDMFYDTLTVNNAVTLTTNGFRVFVKNTLTNSGDISWNGVNGSNGVNASTNAAVAGGAGGTALTSQNLYGSGAGKAGGASGAGGAGGGGSNGSNGTAGDAITNSFATSFSSTSGAGGNGGSSNGAAGTAGSAGATGTITLSSIRPYNSIFGVQMFDLVAGSSPAQLKYNSNVGGAGGGGGGGASAGGGVGGAGGGGAGSGSGAGTVVLCARTIVNNGTIRSIGGNGGNGGNGANGTATVGGQNNGGGGGGGAGTGGPGGALIAIYSTLSGSGTFSVAGGSAGTVGAKGLKGTGGVGGNDGIDGSAGSTGVSGKLVQLIV